MKKGLFSLPRNRKYSLWTCQKVTETLVYLLGNIYIRFGSKLYGQKVGIPMGTNCTPLLLICFYFAMGGMIDAFNSTDDLLNIDNIHFERMVHRIFPTELQLNKNNASDTEAAFLDLSIHNDTVSTKLQSH